MIETGQITAFFGWCALLNMALLVITTLLVCRFQARIAAYHSRLFALDEAQVKQQYFQYLSHYKIVTVTFFLVPYLALKIMA